MTRKPETANISALIPTGWQEAVISVTDIDAMIGFFVEILGWEVRCQGTVERSQLNAWKLPEEASARYAVVANCNCESGFVRILQFDEVRQVRIRDHDQAWDVGGIYNMHIRVSNIAEIAEKMTKTGWQAVSAPVKFTFGSKLVWEWIPRHKDGVRIALIERVEPPLPDWPAGQISSSIFNSAQMVADMNRASDFYQNILGFQTFLDTQSLSKSPGENVLGLSHQAMMQVTRNVRVVNPGGSNDGSIELVAFEDYDGRNFASHSKPPNLGNLMLRFPVPDAGGLALYLKDKGISLEYEPIAATLEPYGAVKIFAIRAPDGAWLEFFEMVS